MNIRHNKILNMKMLEKIRIIKHQKITNKNSVEGYKTIIKISKFCI